ncbi:MAG: hypothetical protein ACREOK_08480 [Gemmatimonadaceae bacterium]
MAPPRITRSALLGFMLCSAPVAALLPQDSLTTRPPLLGADTMRIVPFQREYAMLAWVGDSTVPVGSRTIRLDAATHAGKPAWLIVETRTGAVPAAESLYVGPDFRPLQWSASLGTARLTLAFSRDSMFGGTTGPAGRQTIIQAGGPSLIVSIAMLEALFPAMDWTPYRSDSVSVLVVDHVSSTVTPAELAVIGEDSVDGRPAWIVVLRAPARSVLFWVDQQTGTLLRVQQLLPLNGASMLEYRPSPLAAQQPGAPPPPTSR